MIDISSTIDQQDSTIHDALNLGKGTLESQILKNIDTKMRKFENHLIEKVNVIDKRHQS